MHQKKTNPEATRSEAELRLSTRRQACCNQVSVQFPLRRSLAYANAGNISSEERLHTGHGGARKSNEMSKKFVFITWDWDSKSMVKQNMQNSFTCNSSHFSVDTKVFMEAVLQWICFSNSMNKYGPYEIRFSQNKIQQLQMYSNVFTIKLYLEE